MEKTSITQKKGYIIPVVILNLIGIGIMINFMLMLFSSNTSIVNPDSMIPVRVYEVGGIALLFGILPMAAANLLMFFWLKKKHKVLSLLSFLPLLICVFCAGLYLVADWKGQFSPKAEQDQIVLSLDFRCDEDIYGIFVERYDEDGNLKGSSFGCNADRSAFKPGDPISVVMERSFDFPADTPDEFEMNIKVYVVTDKTTAQKISEDIGYDLSEGDAYEISDGIQMLVAFGNYYDYVITGNGKDGFVVK